jgi:hypothetical protein
VSYCFPVLKRRTKNGAADNSTEDKSRCLPLQTQKLICAVNFSPVRRKWAEQDGGYIALLQRRATFRCKMTTRSDAGDMRRRDLSTHQRRWTNSEKRIGKKRSICAEKCRIWDITPCSPLKANRRFGRTYPRKILAGTQLTNQYLRERHIFGVLLLLEWFYSPCGPSPLFQFPDIYFFSTIGRTPWMSDQLIERPLLILLDGKWPIILLRGPLGALGLFGIRNQKPTFLWVNLLTLEPFAPLNGATWGPSPMGGTSYFSLIYFRMWLWWRSGWNERFWQGKPKYSEKTCPDATFSTTNPTWRPGPPRWEASD